MRFFPARGLPVTVVIVISLGGLAMLAVGLVSLASFKIAERNTIELTRDKAGMILDAIQGRIQSHLEPVRTLVEGLAETIAASRIDIGQQSDLETALLAAVMATPQICDVGGETWRVKEATADEDVLEGWGSVERRGPLWEATCAGVYLQAGADILVMAHPEAVKLTRETIERLF